MPFQGAWYLTYQVIEIRLWGDIRMEDMRQITHFVAKSLQEVEAHNPRNRAYLLIDMQEVTRMPPIYLMVPEALPVLRFKNRDLVIYISRNQAIRSIMDITAHITRLSMAAVETRQEALRILEAALIKEDLQYAERQQE